MAQGPAIPRVADGTVTDRSFPANKAHVSQAGEIAFASPDALSELRMIRMGMQLLLNDHAVNVNLEELL